jgi:hypothetical protein
MDHNQITYVSFKCWYLDVAFARLSVRVQLDAVDFPLKLQDGVGLLQTFHPPLVLNCFVHVLPQFQHFFDLFVEWKTFLVLWIEVKTFANLVHGIFDVANL